jgi:hypothetical protein
MCVVSASPWFKVATPLTCAAEYLYCCMNRHSQGSGGTGLALCLDKYWRYSYWRALPVTRCVAVLCAATILDAYDPFMWHPFVLQRWQSTLGTFVATFIQKTSSLPSQSRNSGPWSSSLSTGMNAPSGGSSANGINGPLNPFVVTPPPPDVRDATIRLTCRDVVRSR